MSNVLYPFSKMGDSFSPGTFLYITDATFDKDWHSYSHRHHYPEIFCIIGGTGEFEIEGNRFPVGAGDIVIVNANNQHTEFSTPKNPLKYFVVGIDDLEFVFSRNKKTNPIIKNPELFLNIKFIMGNMIEEMNSQKKHYNNICKLMADILVFNLLRQAEIQVSFAKTQNISKETRVVRSYIDENYSTEITLDLLSEKALLSKFYLTRKFTDEVGIPPMKYLTEKRLQVAEGLLSYTNHTVGQISEMVGYSSHSYFAQIYRKHKNISPGEFRKAHN